MYKLSKEERESRERMRGKYHPNPKWYGVMTHCGREREIRERIVFDFSGDNLEEVLLPELEASLKRYDGRRMLPELLFRSYVFLRCRMNDAIYMTVSAYNAVYSILGRAYRIPSVIEDSEMIHLKGVLASYPMPTLSPRLNIGAEAVVTEGLMEGMRGRVIEFNADFVKLETYFSFFDNGTSVIVSVPRGQVQLDETGMFRLPRYRSTKRIPRGEG